MKAVRIGSYNATPALEDVPATTPGSDDVLVRVAAASLNPLDVKLQKGFMHDFFPLPFPYTIGTDLAGTVEAVGSTVSGWSAGDRIVARTDPTAGGALAETAVVPASYLVRLPQAVSVEDAAGLPTAAGTAWQALIDMADLKRGQTVLVHAGAGGVGSFAIQFARHVGARVIATASGEGVDIARRLGADQVIDYRAEDFAAKVSDVDVVLDTIGGETQQRSFGTMRAGAVLLATAMPPDEALAKAHNVTATFVFHQSNAARLGRIVAELEAGRIRVLKDRTVPLVDQADAFDYQASGRAKGKIVLTV